jgi:heme-degrading monooxygenase HmoA
MIVRQVSFKVSIEKQAEFLSFWRDEYREAMSRQPGFVAARLLKATDSDDDLQITLEFASEEQAAAWRASPEHKRLGPKLKEYAPALTVKALVPLA